MARYTVSDRMEEGVQIYTLKDAETESTVEVIPALGNTCVRFQRRLRDMIVDLIEPAPGIGAVRERPSGFGNPILFPFPNRVRQGRYTFQGRTYEFEEKTHLGNAIHGLVYTRPWQVESNEASDAAGATLVSRFVSDDFSEIEKQYPFPFTLRVTYTLRGGALRFEVEVINRGETAMPMGFGIHPYFSVPLFATTDPSECLITVPANKIWELQQFLPTGRQIEVQGRYDLRSGKPFARMKFDDVFTDLTERPSRCVIDDRPQRVRFVLESDAQFREIVVYTPPNRRAIAIEPYTCVTDAVNLEPQGIDAGLIILSSGGKFRGRIDMRAEAY